MKHKSLKNCVFEILEQIVQKYLRDPLKYYVKFFI